MEKSCGLITTVSQRVSTSELIVNNVFWTTVSRSLYSQTLVQRLLSNMSIHVPILQSVCQEEDSVPSERSIVVEICYRIEWDDQEERGERHRNRETETLSRSLLPIYLSLTSKESRKSTL